MLLLPSADFFSKLIFQKSFQEPYQWQTVWIQIRTEKLLVLIWQKVISKQQKLPLARKELVVVTYTSKKANLTLCCSPLKVYQLSPLKVHVYQLPLHLLECKSKPPKPHLSPTLILSAFSFSSCSFLAFSSSNLFCSSGSTSRNLPILFLSLNALTESVKQIHCRPFIMLCLGSIKEL